MKRVVLSGLTLCLLPMSVIAEEESSWYKSLGKSIGEKARVVQEKIDPDGSLKEKALNTYESSKEFVDEKYEAAETYVNENKGDWKKDGMNAYESVKEKTKAVYEGVKEGYEQQKQEEIRDNPPNVDEQTRI